ncbi:MAG: heavy metal translocating P-type ATPase [Prevotella sp.]|nr:cadmium-translocating P-type ATPase [Prevotella sp.]MDY4218559.1 heavy metal translocating P-type ATPase [Prevotella sp.]
MLIGAKWMENNLQLSMWQMLCVYLFPYFLIGSRTLHEALDGIKDGDLFNENFLMSIATIGALFIGFLPNAESEFMEAVGVMLFFRVGMLFESYAEGKSKDNIAHLMDIRPDIAYIERNGERIAVSPETINVGEHIIVSPGEKIPLDGIIRKGSSSLNTAALTGESAPRDVSEGDEVVSGSVNLSGVITIEVNKPFGESTVAKIIRLVESADEKKSKSEAFITKFARIYTPIVIFIALFLAFIPPFFFEGAYIDHLATWLYRALTFLLVSCPCALVISIPLTFFGGIGGASRKGILIKGSNYFDTLARLNTIVFDKTGTLTHGQFDVAEIKPIGLSAGKLLAYAAAAERYSSHPIALALARANKTEGGEEMEATDIEEIAGKGLKACVGGQQVAVGNAKMMQLLNISELSQADKLGTVVYVVINEQYAGHIVVSDKPKTESQQAIERLKKLGIQKTVMLTGDRKDVAEDVARTIGIDDCRSELLPTDKVEHVESLLNECQENQTLAFVGDGINDAPVLARADVGIAMGGLGSDAAIEAADVVLMDDRPTKIATAIAIAQRTLRIARENIAFAIGVKVTVLLLSAFGYGTMMLAIFADIGVMVLVVLNAMRALRTNQQ